MIKKLLFFSITFLLSSFATYAQNNIDELGVVWSKTYGTGNINKIKANAGGTYTAAGQTWNNDTPAGIQKTEGLVIEFDESGNELRRATARIPQYYLDDPNHADLSTINAYFDVALKTDDGGFLAFGHLYNSKVPATEKTVDWTGVGAANNQLLKVGIWIVKFDSNLMVTLDTLVRGTYRIADGWYMSDGNIAIAGFDDTTNGGTGGYITLLREYDQNGTLISDKRANYREIRSFYKYPDSDDFIAVTVDRFLKINANLDVTSASNISSLLGIGSPSCIGISPELNGGYFIASHLNTNANQVTLYNNGVGTYRLNSANARVYSKTRVPSDSIFSAPLLLAGNTTPPKYIGTVTTSAINGSSVVTTGNYIYELTDDGSFNYRAGDQYPNNTVLDIAGQTDGFFSRGMSDEGLAAIAKLSTCALFKITDIGSTHDTLAVNDANTATFEGRNLSYEGNKGTVALQWTLRDVTPGANAIANWASVVKTGTGDIPVQNFVLARNQARLQYDIVITDTYVENAQQLNCQQSYILQLDMFKTPVITASDDTVCENDGTVVTLTLDEFIGDVVKWQYAYAPFTTWIDVNNSKVNPLIVNNLSKTVLYRAIVNDGVEEYVADSATITVMPAPVVSVNDPSMLCIGGTRQLSPSTGVGTWVSSSTTIATVTNAGVVTGVGEGAVTFTYTEGGCSSSITMQVSSQLLPLTVTPPTSEFYVGLESAVPAEFTGSVVSKGFRYRKQGNATWLTLEANDPFSATTPNLDSGKWEFSAVLETSTDCGTIYSETKGLVIVCDCD